MEKKYAQKLEIAGNWDSIKDRLFLSVWPTEKISAYGDMLYESIGPLALVPRILLSMDGEWVKAGYFSEETARNLEVSSEEILAQAKGNGEKLFPTAVLEISENLLVSSFSSIRDLGLCPYGGATLFYEGNLDFFRKKIGKDYYILPLSISEMLLIPKDEEFEPSDVLEILQESRNEYIVPEEKKLGDFVLLYKDDKVSVVAEA